MQSGQLIFTKINKIGAPYIRLLGSNALHLISARAPSQTPLGELIAPPDLLAAVFKELN